MTAPGVKAAGNGTFAASLSGARGGRQPLADIKLERDSLELLADLTTGSSHTEDDALLDGAPYAHS